VVRAVLRTRRKAGIRKVCIPGTLSGRRTAKRLTKKKAVMEFEIYRKYGKDVNMRYLKRDLEKIKRMINNCRDFSEGNLVPIDKNIEYDCRICHSKYHKEFTIVHGYHYSICDNCDSIVLLNIPDAKKLYASENSEASSIYLDDEVFLKRAETIGLPKVNFVLESIGDTKIGKKNIWCDVGCGVGEALMALKTLEDIRWEGIGIEIDPAEIKFGVSKGLNIVEGFIDPNNPVDYLTKIISDADVTSMFNVLEHIEHPDKIIDFYKKHIKKGAYLVIEAPRHPSMASFVNLLSPDLTYRHITPPIHFQVFSEKAIEILTGDEFRLIATWGFGQGYTDVLTNTMLLGNIKESSLYQQLMDISNDVQKVIDEKGYADQMVYVLQKK
jgi:SAM-dependent methyltransferase